MPTTPTATTTAARLTLHAREPAHAVGAVGVLQPRVGVVLNDDEAVAPRGRVDRAPPRRAHRRAGRVLPRGDDVQRARRRLARRAPRRDGGVDRRRHDALGVDGHGQQVEAFGQQLRLERVRVCELLQQQRVAALKQQVERDAQGVRRAVRDGDAEGRGRRLQARGQVVERGAQRLIARHLPSCVCVGGGG